MRRRGLLPHAGVERFHHGAAMSRKALACGLPGRLADDRAAVVGRVADPAVERHFAEERRAERLRLVARAAVGENVGAAAAMRADEIAHVLDDAEHRHLDLLEHRDAAPRVDQREVLRRRDDHRAGERRRSAPSSVARRRCRAACRRSARRVRPRRPRAGTGSAPTSPSVRARRPARPRRSGSRSTSP